MKSCIVLMLVSAGLLAQPPRGPGGPPPPHGNGRGPAPASPSSMGPSGTWWRDPAIVQKLGLTAEQQKKIEDEFQQNRIHLIDLTATLEKEQVTMEPLLEADHPDEPKILVQIDRIAQARAELEKANARMLLGFRNVLSQDQWVKLKVEKTAPGPQPQPHGVPPGGSGGSPPPRGR